jgi:hypothetical protein
MLEGLMRFLGLNRNVESTLEVRELKLSDSDANGFYIVYPDGEPYAGPYKRAGDAQGQLTRLRKSYTPASRRPRD